MFVTLLQVILERVLTENKVSNLILIYILYLKKVDLQVIYRYKESKTNKYLLPLFRNWIAVKLHESNLKLRKKYKEVY